MRRFKNVFVTYTMLHLHFNPTVTLEIVNIILRRFKAWASKPLKTDRNSRNSKSVREGGFVRLFDNLIRENRAQTDSKHNQADILASQFELILDDNYGSLDESKFTPM
jgi:hypothetical protein